MAQHDPQTTTSTRATATRIADAAAAALATLAILGMALMMPAIAGQATIQLMPSLVTNIRPAETVWLSLLGFQATVIVLAIWASGMFGDRRTALSLVPVAQGRWRLPLVVSACLLAATSLISYVFFWDTVLHDLRTFRALLPNAPVWMAFLALCIGAPLAEEILFRGFLLGRLALTPLGFWGGALIANAGWTALHFDYSWVGLADVFLAGLLFSWALWRTGSLWVPIVFHALYNTVVFLVLMGPLSDYLSKAATG